MDEAIALNRTSSGGGAGDAAAAGYSGKKCKRVCRAVEAIFDRHLAVAFSADRHHHNVMLFGLSPNRTKRVPSHHIESGRAAR